MDKQKYFEGLAELETAKLFLTNKTDLLSAEIDHNCFYISLTLELAKQITVNDFLNFLSKIKLNRQKQLVDSNLEVDLIYYLWFDEMAGQLRFNFINTNHKELPFSCNLKFAKTEKEIIEDFLRSNYLDGIPMKESTSLQENGETIKQDESAFTLNIYQQKITLSLSNN